MIKKLEVSDYDFVKCFDLKNSMFYIIYFMIDF
jgi:hypothetical protein